MKCSLAGYPLACRTKRHECMPLRLRYIFGRVLCQVVGNKDRMLDDCVFEGSLGVRVIGGNRVGIFVSAVQEDSPAALNSIRPGERILSVNDKSMVGITREEVCWHFFRLTNSNFVINS